MAASLGAARPAAAAEAVCSDPATIFCEDFERGDLDLWQDGYDPDLHGITTVPSNIFQGSHALETTYPAGGDGGWLTRWFMPGYDEVFARLYVKFPPGWQCGQNCTKLMGLYGNRVDDRWSGFGQAGIRPTGADFFVTMLVTLNWYREPAEVIFYAYFPEMRQAADGMYWGNFFFQNDPRQALQPDRWYCLELNLKANTPGQRDGHQRMWIDGVFKGETLHMRWRDTTEVMINAFQLSFSARAVPFTDRIWMDNIVVSRQRIGCAGTDTPGAPPAAPTGLRVQ